MIRLNTRLVALVSFLIPLYAGLASETPGKQTRSGPRSLVCDPAAGRLNARATLAGREGVYLLTLVAAIDGRDVRSAHGSLALRVQPPGLDSLGGASTPLHGFTDVDLDTVGAYPAGSPTSRSPYAPGVLVLESDGTGNRRILLRIGADANRRDSALFDGAYTVLDVRRIDGGGFAGVWRSGVHMSRAGGYFCAWRADMKRPGATKPPRGR